ncbi:MAG TPA: CPBP family glutamic-type intramembrane protease [Lacipirellulaceae bacterium]|nr:CPBP family glutamic-type intramembrane protease [Lacipirellulaceae bacterium]
MDAMKRLYSARNAVEAHDLRFVLAAHGIEAKVFGDRNALEAGFAFTPLSAPGVYVNEADVEAANTVLQQFKCRAFPPTAEGKWICPSCGAPVEAQFAACWNCQSARGDARIETALITPSDDDEQDGAHVVESTDNLKESTPNEGPILGPIRSTRNVWIEVLIVLALTSPFIGGRAVGTVVIRALGIPDTASTFYLAALLAYALDAAVVLMVMRLSREPWSTFGITELTLVDFFTAGLICVADYLLTEPGNDIFHDLLTSIYGAPYVHRLIVAHRLVIHAHGFAGFVALLALAVSIGLKEELIARAYLIPRLERLLGSTFGSVVVSAVVFALLHWFRGAIIMWNAFLIGLIYGTAFVWTRRLWPVVIAHALTDFAVLLHCASIASN